MANDCIPRRDARFHAWRNNFVMYVNGHLADLGLAAGDVVDLNNSAVTWTTDYPAQAAVQAARQSKDNARDGLEGTIRPPAHGVMQPYA
ncbi:MAG: hypothetical protein WBE26_17180 [Phycisphaerae bacterium]